MADDMSVEAAPVEDVAAESEVTATAEAFDDALSTTATDETPKTVEEQNAAYLAAQNWTELGGSVIGGAGADAIDAEGKLHDRGNDGIYGTNDDATKAMDSLNCKESGQLHRLLRAMPEADFQKLLGNVSDTTAEKLKGLYDPTVKPDYSAQGSGAGGAAGASKKKLLELDLDGDGKPDLMVDPQTGQIFTPDGKEVGKMDPAEIKDSNGDGKLDVRSGEFDLSKAQLGSEVQQLLAGIPQTGLPVPDMAI